MSKNNATEWRNAWALMRIPFSIYLMPIFFFALSTAEKFSIPDGIFVFIILHLFLYPASSGYNSMCDKDTGAVGGLENPPPVNPNLKTLVSIFDLFTIFLAWMLNSLFALMCLIILLVSKAYSYPRIRIKKYPVWGALLVIFFQGSFTYLAVHAGLGYTVDELLNTPNLLFSLVSTFFLAGSYPMTQIYQHKQDKENDDKTLSLMLGVKGTFIFSAVAFIIASALLLFMYVATGKLPLFRIYMISILPILVYFFYWFYKSMNNVAEVNYRNTMRLNLISSVCLSAGFIIIWIINNFYQINL